MTIPRCVVLGSAVAWVAWGCVEQEHPASDAGATGTVSLAVIGEWASAGSMTAVRYRPTATLLRDGQVLVAGGCGAFDTSGVCTAIGSSAELYDAAATSWAATGSLTTHRYLHTATLLPSGLVLVAGGWDGTGCTTSVELYDPAARSWTETRPMATGRCTHTATQLASGRVLIAGGWDGYAAVSAAEIYDPVAGTWAGTWPMGGGRVGHVAVRLPSGQVLVAGGNDGTVALATAELFDPATERWRATGSMASRREFPAAALLASGKVLVAGGWDGTADLSSSELFDSSVGIGSWSGAGGAMTRRHYSGLAQPLPSGEVLLEGGWDGSSALSTAELYDPVPATWRATGSMRAGRGGHAGVLLPSGQVLVAGGDNGVSVLASAEVYDTGATFSCRACAADGTCTDLAAGFPCAICSTCDGAGACAGTPADDPVCGTIDCGGLDTDCRTYSDLTAARCAGPGTCKPPNVPASCTVFTDAAEGTLCPDVDACNGDETCRAGVCSPGTPVVCDDGSACTSDRCDASGGCVFAPLPDGTTCSDGNGCNGVELCAAGMCTPGTPVTCDDGNECTVEWCDPATGCSVPTPLPDGAPCADDDLCNGDERCLGGSCAPSDPLDCDDDNDCTVDTCAPDAGCVHANASDGTWCSAAGRCGGACASGVCTGGVPVDCDDDDPCTEDSCAAVVGECVHDPSPDGTACDDGNSCTTGEECRDGACSGGTPRDCNDDDPCTTDRCGASGCAHDPSPAGTPCDDGDPTTTDDVCGSDGRCAGTAEEVSDGGSGCGCRAVGVRTSATSLVLVFGLVMVFQLRRGRW